MAFFPAQGCKRGARRVISGAKTPRTEAGTQPGDTGRKVIF
jgi:hypothetical protein